MNEYEYEEVRGLPGRLPEGETILWQGAPAWRALARRTFHVRSVAIYFVIICAVRGASASVIDGANLLDATVSALLFVPVALVGLALLAGLAWWHARTTVYTITDRRVVLRYGIAVQLAINLPFKEIAGAALLQLPMGHGDLPLELCGEGRIAYLHLWPHARPNFFRSPQPMLRCIPDAASVAKILTAAWAEERGIEPSKVVSQSSAAPVANAAAPATATAGALG